MVWKQVLKPDDISLDPLSIIFLECKVFFFFFALCLAPVSSITNPSFVEENNGDKKNNLYIIMLLNTLYKKD